MRVMMIASLPVETFNAAVKDGSTQAKMKKILDQLKPEAAYFTALNGKRTAILIVDLADASRFRRWLSRGFFHSTRLWTCIR
jgi:hypothetical protein